MAKDNSKRKKQLKRRASRRDRFPRTTTIEGKKWVSEIEAEEKRGIPRELLYLWSDVGPELPAPSSAEDRSLRRKVLLRYHLKLCGLSWRGDGSIPDLLLMDCWPVLRGEYPKGRARVERCQVLACWFLLYMPPGPGASVGPEDAEGIATALSDDLTGPAPTREQIRDEYRRFYGMAG